MLRTVKQSQLKVVAARLEDLLRAPSKSFEDLKPSMVPERPGVYVITALLNGLEHAYYVGRTKNLRNRLYRHHLMGQPASARLKKHLIASGECASLAEAKQFIRDFCSARWIEHEGFRERGAIEGYATALLFPKYGIYEEH
jgi:predicted GIY-YIG superfamily endonuclease